MRYNWTTRVSRLIYSRVNKYVLIVADSVNLNSNQLRKK